MSIQKYHVSKNLFDKDNFIDGGNLYPASSGLVASTNTDILLIPCKPSAYYTVSRTANTKRFIICFTETANLEEGMPVYNLTGVSVYDPKQMYTLTAQSGADSKYLLIYYAKHGGSDRSTAEEISASLASMMVNEGSTALPYEPYGNTWSEVGYKKYGTETDTITTLPKQIIGDGQAISAYTIKGNVVQNGTPTTSNPIYPQECGDRTENLFDGTLVVGYYSNNISTLVPGEYYRSFRVQGLSDGQYTVSWSKPVLLVSAYYNGVLHENIGEELTSYAVTSSDGDIAFSFRAIPYGTPWSDTTTIMLNTGSTTKTYEPYGYKIPITCGGQTQNIYLQEPIRKIGEYVDAAASNDSATRCVKKRVFDGIESGWTKSGTYADRFFIRNILTGCGDVSNTAFCSHFSQVFTNTNRPADTFIIEEPSSVDKPFNIKITNDSWTLTDFTNWLKDQYAAGTPVTIWYVLATPTTETITAPTIPTTGTAESFDVSTTLKPSEVSLTYHGWHEHQDTKFTV